MLIILFLLSKTQNLRSYSDIISKGFERSVYCNEYKTKSKDKNTTNEFRYFLELNFVGAIRLFDLVYSNNDDDATSFKA